MYKNCGPIYLLAAHLHCHKFCSYTLCTQQCRLIIISCCIFFKSCRKWKVELQIKMIIILTFIFAFIINFHVNLYFFIWFQGTVHCPLISFPLLFLLDQIHWLQTHLTFCLHSSVFICPSLLWRTILSDTDFSVDNLFLPYFKYTCPLPFTVVSVWFAVTYWLMLHSFVWFLLNNC